jgi:hypothetical protein
MKRASEKWRKDWVSKKIDIAQHLNSGGCGGSYGEAVMILCAALSSLAAEVWPGRKRDAVRFVQLLVDYAPQQYDMKRISIPLLIAHLRNSKRDREVKIISDAFLKFDPSRVLVGDDVDKYENDILSMCKTVNIKDLRNHSYAYILYDEIRSGYAHEYRAGELADPWPMTQRDAFISYVNWACKPDRHIHFHVNKLSQLLLMIAERIDAIGNSLPLDKPMNWWLRGSH